MKYLIVQDWSNTTDNHAGMKYLCSQLALRYPEEFKVYVIKDYYTNSSNNIFLRKMYSLWAKCQFMNNLRKLFFKLNANLKSGDKVFLMEYMELLCPQLYLAKKIKKKNIDVKIYAMVHLVPSKLDDSFTDAEFKVWTKYVDFIITMGSSLTEYLSTRGFSKNRIITAFHYVDNDYYNRSVDNYIKNNKIKVIAMGNQMRNVSLLRDIILNNQDVKFIVCQGVYDLSKYFSDCNNVQLIPFVSEGLLKEYMCNSDISLNVMKDTIGSNVIVTSMAMGLAMICSNVGSIHDYCDTSNSIFCDNDKIGEFSDAIRKLNNNRSLLQTMKQNSINKSKDFSIQRFYDFINDNSNMHDRQ